MSATLLQRMKVSVVNFRDKLTLAKMPHRRFDISNLAKLSGDDLKEAFASIEATESFDEDNAAISALFPFENILGGVNPGDRRAIYSLVRALTLEKILEIGTHIGASTMYFAHALARTSDDAHITTVDIYDVNGPDAGWRRVGLPQSPKAYATELAYDDRVTFNVSPAIEYLEKAEEKYDLIFLDGDHAPKAVYEEVSAALSLLKSDGKILLHDYYPRGKPLFSGQIPNAGPYLGMRRVMAEEREISVLPLGDLPWATKFGTSKTSLALVTRR